VRRILIFEDEPVIADTLIYALETDGFYAERVATAEEGLRRMNAAPFDLIILDVGLPDRNGFEVCKEIRATASIPILFLTARADEIDRVVGLEIGGDDYIVKPFSPREVSARVKAVLRRTQPQPQPSLPSTELFVVDEQKKTIRYCGRLLDLSRHEYGLLKLLVEHPEQVFSRAQLLERVWEDPDMTQERTVDSHVKAIRAKLRVVDDSRDPIETHRGFGYSLTLSSPESRD
jgi:two-component system catabolic regulation response regulator CreB